MDIIILDTNIFLKENFLEGSRIKELLRLSEEEYIKIVLTRIIVEETKNNFKKWTKIAVKNYNAFKKPIESRALRNIPAGKAVYANLNQNLLSKEFNEEFEDILLDSNVEIIEYSEINIKNVFQSYFQNEYPFAKANKKEEFPDAFSLKLIEKWCEDNSKSVILFSKDQDFLNSDHSEFLSIKDNYEDYLEEKLNEILDLRKSVLKILFEGNSDFIDDQVKGYFENELEDISPFVGNTFSEIYDIQKPNVNILDKDYKVVAIHNDEEIEIEIFGSVDLAIDITVDDENDYSYDSETKTAFYFDTKIVTLEGKGKFKASVFASVISESEYSEDLEIMDFETKSIDLYLNDEIYD